MIAAEALEALATGPRLQVAAIRRLENEELIKLESRLVSRINKLSAVAGPAATRDRRTAHDRLGRVRTVLDERGVETVSSICAEIDEVCADLGDAVTVSVAAVDALEVQPTAAITDTIVDPPGAAADPGTVLPADGPPVSPPEPPATPPPSGEEVCGDLEVPTKEILETPTGVDLAAEVASPALDPAAVREARERDLDLRLASLEAVRADAEAEGEDEVETDRRWSDVAEDLVADLASAYDVAWAAQRVLRARQECERRLDELRTLERRAEARRDRLVALLEPALRTWVAAHPLARDPRTKGTWRLPDTTVTLRHREVAARLVVEDADRLAEALGDADYEAACEVGALTLRHRANTPKLLAWLRAREDALADPDAPPERLPAGCRWQDAETRFYVQD